MKIAYSVKSKKQLLKLPKKEQIKILKKTSVLRNNPLSGKKLKGEFKGLFSFKFWPYRIIYYLDWNKKAVFIVTVRHRQSAYNK